MEATLKQVPWENVHKLIETLEKKLPETVVVVNFIKINLEWMEKTPDISVHILTVNGDWGDGSVVCVADGVMECDRMHGVFYATAEKEEEFKIAAKASKLIDWRRVKRLPSVLQRNIPMVVEILEYHEAIPVNVVNIQCFLYYISAEEGAECPLPQLPANVRVGPLEEKHLQVLCDNWPHYIPEYRSVNLNLIKRNLTVGVFEKNEHGDEELASMVLQSEYGAIGLLQTVPEHRRKGYAAIAMAHIIRLIGQKGYMPFGTVLTWNDASSSLFRKFGLKKLEGVTSFVCIGH